MSHVDLGFSQKCQPWQVESYLFPSKIGGKPAWLDWENLPSSENLQCENCQKPLIFLCQIYAPFEEDEDNFHRTVYIFICRDSKCCIRNSSCNIKAFRCSLRRENKFYDFEPPTGEKRDFCVSKWVKLCRVCGSRGEKTCSKCKKVRYCSREHQIADWKEGHKSECQSETSSEHVSKVLFRQSEIVIEAEDFEEKHISESAELQKFDKLKNEGKVGTMSDYSDSELEKFAACDNDKAFMRFKERISDNNEQVLRYERGGQVLWIADNPKPDLIPNCEFCGCPRRFEFQIMPQLLAILHEHELDIGIVAVYTCSKSCIPGPAYKKEFVFKQDVEIKS